MVKSLRSFDKYFKSFVLSFQNSMEYRANFLLSMVSVIFPIIIQVFLWTAVFDSSQDKTVYGYSYVQMISYVILAGIVSKFVSAGFEWEISDDIKNGGLNKYIIKPIGYFQYRVSCFLGQKVVHLTIIALIISAILTVLNRFLGLNLELWRIAIFILTVFLALALNFLIAFCVSMTAFWLNEAWGIFIISSILVNIISGGVFPLDIFGSTALKIFNFLPFKYTIAYPVNVLNGRLLMDSAFQGIIIQCLWIVILTASANVLWRVGTRKYVAVGG